MAQYQSNITNLGGMWKKTDKNNELFLSISLNIPLALVKANTTQEGFKFSCLAFKNKNRDPQKNHPHYQVLVFADDKAPQGNTDDIPY